MRGSEFNDLRVFETICRLRSFAGAARELRISASAVSQTLRQLEERLGVRLLNRTTRSVAPNDAGAKLYAELSPALAHLDAALESVNAHRNGAAGTVRLHTPRIAFARYVEPRLAEFHRRYPDVVLDVTVDDALIDIVQHGFDVGIRLGELLDSDMVAIKLDQPLRQKTVAAPAYLATRSIPLHPRDLLQHACINWRQTGMEGTYKWEYAKDGQHLAVAVRGPLIVNDRAAGLTAAVHGIGVAMSAEARVDDLVRAGQLVELLSDWTPTFPGFHLHYPQQRDMLAATKAWIGFISGRSS